MGNIFLCVFGLIASPIFIICGYWGFKICGIGGAIVGVLLSFGIVGALGEQLGIIGHIIIIVMVVVCFAILCSIFGASTFALWGVGN